MGGGEVLKKGWLIKSPPLDGGPLKTWRKRWFLLLSSKVLEYYKSENGERKGVINLEDCHSVNSNLSHKRYKYVFNIETKDRVYFLVSKTRSEMEVWVEAVCKVCGLHTEYTTTVANTLPLLSSSKSKNPSITQPVYATTTKGIPFTEQFKTSTRVDTNDSVYSLAAATEYDVRQQLQRDSATVPSGVPLSEALSSKGLGSNRTSTASGGREDVAGNRLSETALFSPRPGDNLGYLGSPADPQSLYSGGSSHQALLKTRSATLAPSLLDEGPSGLEHRSHTNVYSSHHQQPLAGAQMLSNGYMRPRPSGSEAPPLPPPYTPSSSDRPPSQVLDPESSSRDSSLSVPHAPPPIDRSKKPLQMSVPPTIDRKLKPAKQGDVESSDSSEGSPPERRWSTVSPPYTKLPSDSTEDARGEESESQFSVSDMPQMTPCSTHYTQVDFNPDTRRPIPLPRKLSPNRSLGGAEGGLGGGPERGSGGGGGGGGGSALLVPKPRRVNYTDIDIQATSQLSDRLQRQQQKSVRAAEFQALAEREYVNIDRSGAVDDETDPDYYTHMRSFNLDEADKPDYFTVKMYQTAQQQAQAQADRERESSHTISQSAHDTTS